MAVKKKLGLYIDPYLLASVVALLVLGLTMVASSSMVIAERKLGQPFYFFWHQLLYVGMGTASAMVMFACPLAMWRKLSSILLAVTLVLLLLVLVPGIGRSVNGSMRWLNLGLFAFQVSELAKFSVIVYLAGYMVRHAEALKNEIFGFLRPVLLLGVIAALLLKEPDFGAAVVLLTTALSMLFLAGVPLSKFAGLLCMFGCATALLAISAPYRLERLTSFLDPWADQFDSGYQLTQALIAFGRGEWFGVGLGASVQKLFYLPEAHTDFLFAVLAEELGLLGGLCVLFLYSVLVWRGLRIGFKSHSVGNLFGAYVAYGVTLWVGLQAIINVGVNAGVLPTKGLTLPLMSYGGSSIVVICVAIGLLFRIDVETRAMELPSDKRLKKR